MEYINPQELYAQIREELSSYFSTGAVDDLMFPKYTEYCLKRFCKTSLTKKSTAIRIENGKGELPNDFNSLRSVWTCQTTQTTMFSPRAVYKSYDTRLTPIKKCECPVELPCECNPCKPESEYQVTFKHNEELILKFKTKHLLTPGNVVTKDKCATDCLNFSPTCQEYFELDGCNIFTTIEDGVLYMEYYAQATDEDGDVMIPDNIYIQQYISAYIKFKLFEKLLNSTTDESFNQMNYKYQVAKQEKNEAYVMADTKLKKQTIAQTQASIDRSHRRFKRLKRHYR